MQPIEVMKVFVMVILAIGIILLFLARDKKTKVVKYIPSPACQVMKNYDADCMILANAIHHARFKFELELIKVHINLFKANYMPYQCSHELKIDISRLVSQWKDKRTEIEIKIALLN